MRKFFLLLFLGLLLLPSFSAFAQDEYLESLPQHKNERGITFSLSTSGLGIGGVYRFALPSYFHLGFDLEFFAMRDDKELEFYDPFFNRFFKLNDLNRLFLIPASVELKKRLFTNTIEDNFRPHLILQVGAIYGMNFPRETFIGVGGTNQRVQPENEYELTYNILMGFGVDISTRNNFFATVRPQYRLAFFQNSIAGKKNHSSFEIKFEIGGQF